jgi:hypothetical protein
MNDKMFELLAHARNQPVDVVKAAPYGSAILTPAQLEKFAELIVAECAQACINMGNDYEIKSAGQYQAELFAFAIKQHFGVEE